MILMSTTGTSWRVSLTIRPRVLVGARFFRNQEEFEPTCEVSKDLPAALHGAAAIVLAVRHCALSSAYPEGVSAMRAGPWL